MRSVSTTTMIRQLEALLGTFDLRPSECEFVQRLVRYRDAGEVTKLSEGQLNWLTDLYRKHFA